MLWLLLTWIALGLGAACLFGGAAETMRRDQSDDDPSLAEKDYSENLLA